MRDVCGKLTTYQPRAVIEKPWNVYISGPAIHEQIALKCLML
jgi:hypothetical protein